MYILQQNSKQKMEMMVFELELKHDLQPLNELPQQQQLK
jgi:hypothetical protein